MRFQCSGSFTEGLADVDPVAAPETALESHILVPKFPVTAQKYVERTLPTALFLLLLGTGVETVTLTLYGLVESLGLDASGSEYIATTTRWFQFATGQVVTNGTLTSITSGIPAGGTVYARLTADAITAGQTRKLLAAWV